MAAESRPRPPDAAANALARCRQRDYDRGLIGLGWLNFLSVIGAVLLAALGGPQEYADAADYCKALGLNLKERSDGKHKGRRVTTSRNGVCSRR
jgi:hypothetical protein